MEYATHRCRKLKMGEVYFSPEIDTLRSRILAWNLQISKLHSCRVSEDVPFQGLGQGNRAAPTGLAVVSAPIINMVRTAGCGATFVSALSCAITYFACYTFIYNMDVVHTRPSDNHTGSDLILEMQEALDHWEGGLRTSSGALIPSKSHWYVVDFK